jgi:hypothetical protein
VAIAILSLKIRSLLRAEGLWELIEMQLSPALFLAEYAGENVTANKLKKMKVLALKILTMGVKDDFINTVSKHVDPSVAWAALKKAYQAGSQSQILILISQLQSLK